MRPLSPPSPARGEGENNQRPAMTLRFVQRYWAYTDEEDTLHAALRRMTELNIDEIPVVQPDDSTDLIGLLSRRELTSAYTGADPVPPFAGDHGVVRQGLRNRPGIISRSFRNHGPSRGNVS